MTFDARPRTNALPCAFDWPAAAAKEVGNVDPVQGVAGLIERGWLETRPKRHRKRPWAKEAKLGCVAGIRALKLLKQGTDVILARRLHEERGDSQARMGRRPMTPETMAFLHVAMVMENDRIRSSQSFFELLLQLGYVAKAPHPNTMTNWRRFEGLNEDTQIGGGFLLGALHRLFLLTLEPGRLLYDAVVIDSTGLSSNARANWLDCKKGEVPTRSGQDFLEAHLLACRDTKIALAFKITDYDAPGSGDATVAIPLFKEARQRGVMPKAVYADEGYDSDEILAHICDWGADPIVKIAADFKPGTKKLLGLARAQWLRDRSKTEAFWKFYDPRKVVESTFSSIKYWLEERIEAEQPGQRQIEIYCKVIAHNLRQLVSLELDYKRDIDFWNVMAFPPRIDPVTAA